MPRRKAKLSPKIARKKHKSRSENVDQEDDQSTSNIDADQPQPPDLYEKN